MKLGFMKKSKLENVVDSILDDMSKLEANSDEYTTMAENLEKLLKAKSYEKDRRISPDTIAIVAGNLIGIVLILKHEKIDIITSKALSFVLKGRV
jgi:hypothetical protein